MKTDGPETTASPRGAYFVRFRPADERVGFEPVSEEAPAEILAGFKWIARDWSKSSLKKCPLNRLTRRISERKPAAAIVLEPYESEKLPPASPLHVVFEPVTLDETSPTLVELAREAAGAPMTDGTSSVPSEGRAIRRLILRSGIHVFFGLYSLMKLLASYADKGPAATITIIWFVVFLLALGLPIAWYYLVNYDWYIVPGGVIVSGGYRPDRHGRAARFTPNDSALVLEPSGLGFKARLIRDDKIVEQIPLTRTECIALLGAWQSSIAPPELDQLLDLR